MLKKALFGLISLLFLGLVLILASCSPGLQTSATGSTPAPVITPTLGPSILASIDAVLVAAVKGHIVFDAPAAMQYDQTVDVNLSLSPITSAIDLQNLILQQGQAVEGDLEVTSLMKAELRSEDGQAFVIQDFNDTPEQVIIAGEPTEWRWSVTAKKPGDKVLTLSVYRQVQYNGQMYWRTVGTYSNNIHVNITTKQRLLNFDWKWLLGILLTAILIPALWRIIDQSNKKKKKSPRKARAR